MVRATNQKVFNTSQTDDQPKCGAGAAFGKDAKRVKEACDRLGIRKRRTADLAEHREKIRFVNAQGRLRNQLHRSVPKLAAGAVGELFRKVILKPDVVLAHTGGRDVLTALAPVFDEDSLPHSEKILREYGNVSSPSVMLALESYLTQPSNNQQLWLTSFGAGFSAHGCHLTKLT